MSELTDLEKKLHKAEKLRVRRRKAYIAADYTKRWGLRLIVVALGIILILVIFWILFRCFDGSLQGLGETSSPPSSGEAGSPPSSGEDSRSQLGTILFAVATLTLTLIAFLLAILSFFGWFSIKDKVVAEVHKAIAEEKDRQQHRNRLTDAVVFSSLAEASHLDHRKHYWTENAIRRLEMCVPYFDQASKDPEERKHALAVVNNLAFIYALRGHIADGPKAIELTYKAAEMAHKLGLVDVPVHLTQALVLAKFGNQANVSTDELKSSLLVIGSLNSEDRINKATQREYFFTKTLLEQTIAERSSSDS